MLLAAIAIATEVVLFNHPAAPLRVLIPRLAQMTGQRIAVAPDIEWKVLYVRAKNASFEALLTEIARASDGSWRDKTNGTRVLEVNQSVWRSAAKQENEWMRDGVNGAYSQNRLGGNAGKLLGAAIVDCLGVEALLSIPTDSTVVYSTHPSSRQGAMPPLDRSSLEKIVQLENGKRAYMAAVREDSGNAPPTARIKGLEKEIVDESDPYQGLSEVPTKAILRIMRGHSRITATMSFYDNRGHRLFSLLSMLGDMAVPGRKLAKPLPSEPMIFPAGTLTTRDVFNGGPAIRKAAVELGEGDRFLGVSSAVCDQIAKRTSDNLVIGVDEGMMGLAVPDQPFGTVGQALTLSHSRIVQNGWQTYFPSTPRKPTNRALLGEALRRLVASRGKLADWAFFLLNAAAIGDSSDYLTDSMLRVLAIDPQTYGIKRSEPGALLLAFGALTEDQRAELAKGKSLRFDKLPARARRFIERRCFGGRVLETAEQLALEAELKRSTESDEVKNLRRHAAAKRSARMENEPTTVFANGIPGDALLSLTVASDGEQECQLSFTTKTHGFVEPYRCGI